MSTWNSKCNFAQTFSRESAGATLGLVGLLQSITPQFELAGMGTALIQVAFSTNGGTSYGSYVTCADNVALTGIPSALDANTRMKVKVTLTPTDANAVRLTSLAFDVVAKCSTGTWESPDVLNEFLATSPTLAFARASGNTPGTVALHAKTKLSADAEYGAYVPVTSALPEQLPYVQYRVTLTPDVNGSPEVSTLTATYDFIAKSGTWVSAPIDVSNVADKGNTSLTLEATFGALGTVVVYSRSRANVGDTWSQWCTRLSDGSLTHPTNNFVQIGLAITGSAKVTALTFIADNLPQAVQIHTGLNPVAQYDFTTLKDLLVIANGSDSLMKWDAVTATPQLLGGSPPLMSMVETHQNRVWGVEVENPSRLRCSDILTPETWPAFNYFDFNPEDGDHITAITRYGQNLMVSKLRSMAMVTGNSFANYGLTWMDFNYGATGPRAMCATDKYLAYVAMDGIRFTDLVTSILATERLKPDWDKLNLRRLSQAAMIYYRNILLVALPEEGSLVNNVVFAYDSLRNSWHVYRGWSVSAWATFQQFGDVCLLAADSNTGQVYEVFVSDSDDAVPVTYKWRTREMGFNVPERYKLFRNIFLDVEGMESGSVLNIRMYVDGSDTPTGGTLTYNLAPGEQRSIHIMPPVHDVILGRTLTLEFEGTALIKSYVVEYSVKGTIPQEDV